MKTGYLANLIGEMEGRIGYRIDVVGRIERSK